MIDISTLTLLDKILVTAISAVVAVMIYQRIFGLNSKKSILKSSDQQQRPFPTLIDIINIDITKIVQDKKGQDFLIGQSLVGSDPYPGIKKYVNYTTDKGEIYIVDEFGAGGNASKTYPDNVVSASYGPLGCIVLYEKSTGYDPYVTKGQSTSLKLPSWDPASSVQKFLFVLTKSGAKMYNEGVFPTIHEEMISASYGFTPNFIKYEDSRIPPVSLSQTGGEVTVIPGSNPEVYYSNPFPYIKDIPRFISEAESSKFSTLASKNLVFEKYVNNTKNLAIKYCSENPKTEICGFIDAVIKPVVDPVDPKPPVVDPKPPVVDPKPPVVDPKPPVVDPKPPVVEDLLSVEEGESFIVKNKYTIGGVLLVVIGLLYFKFLKK